MWLTVLSALSLMPPSPMDQQHGEDDGRLQELEDAGEGADLPAVSHDGPW